MQTEICGLGVVPPVKVKAEKSPPATPATPDVSLSEPAVPAVGITCCAGDEKPWVEYRTALREAVTRLVVTMKKYP